VTLILRQWKPEEEQKKKKKKKKKKRRRRRSKRRRRRGGSLFTVHLVFHSEYLIQNEKSMSKAAVNTAMNSGFHKRK
jgi:hypothetical protein